MPGPCAVPGGRIQISPDAPSRKVTSRASEAVNSLQRFGRVTTLCAANTNTRGLKRRASDGVTRGMDRNDPGNRNKTHKPKIGESTMKTFILATLLSATAFAGAANAGLMVDATKGPIQITVSGN